LSHDALNMADENDEAIRAARLPPQCVEHTGLTVFVHDLPPAPDRYEAASGR
jgi:hypothetical protein